MASQNRFRRKAQNRSAREDRFLIRIAPTILGKGANSEVREATANGGKKCAVKMFHARLAPQWAAREIESLNCLNARVRSHPFIASPWGFMLHAGRLMIPMDLREGSLEHELEKSRRQGNCGIPESELLGFVSSAAEGLDYLHRLGLLHCDIKPSNLLRSHRHAVISDFGFAWSTAALLNGFASGVNLLDQAGATLEYLAPEVLGAVDHKLEFTPKSDQYALAVTYAFLRQGRHPFRLPVDTATLQQIRIGDADLGSLLRHEREVVRRAMDVEPQNRFDTCSDLAKALAASINRSWTAPELPPDHRVETLIDPGKFDFRYDNSSGELPIVAPPTNSGAKPRSRAASTLIMAGVVAMVLVLAIGMRYPATHLQTVAPRHSDKKIPAGTEQARAETKRKDSVTQNPSIASDRSPVQTRPAAETLLTKKSTELIETGRTPDAGPGQSLEGDSRGLDQNPDDFVAAPVIFGEDFSFSAVKWKPKRGLQQGPRIIWSDAAAIVDNRGFLHLKIRPAKDDWHCAEIVSDATVGYGVYEFELSSAMGNLSSLASRTVVTFAVGDFTPPAHERAFAVELSEWGISGNQNGQALVGPYVGRFQPNIKRFGTGDIQRMHCKVDWRPDAIRVRCRAATAGPAAKQDNSFVDWSFQGKDIPVPSEHSTRLRLGLWIHEGSVPQGFPEQEIIVFSVNYTPLSE